MSIWSIRRTNYAKVSLKIISFAQEHMRKIIIAIDGYSSTGKSTLAKGLAKRLGYTYVDSGAMYRAVTFYVLSKNLFLKNKIIDKDRLIDQLSEIKIKWQHNKQTNAFSLFLNNTSYGDDLRSINVNEHVSEIARISQVRKKLVKLQQEMGQDKGLVMDGRDIGTVVFPDAELKLFLVAKKEIRAKRRFLEARENNPEITLGSIEKNLDHRDYVDATREDSPLKMSEYSIEIDNSYFTKQEHLEHAYKLAMDKICAK